VQDPLGRSIAVTYDAASNRKELDDPNSTKTTYAYDARNRLTSISTLQIPAGAPPPPPVTVQPFAYTLDALGRQIQLNEADGTVRNYGYDSVDRLTIENVTGALTYAKTFTYDPVGNRIKQSTIGSGEGSITYVYDTRDRLTTETGRTYTYDANGNELTKSGEAPRACSLRRDSVCDRLWGFWSSGQTIFSQ
jgi:YD repeat-containing protein